MKTQTLVSLILTIVIFLFSTQINSHGTVASHTVSILQITHSDVPANDNTQEPHQITFVLTEGYHEIHSHAGDDDSHFLHFHFNRLRRDNKFYKVQVITCKILLIIVHLILLTIH